MDIDLNEAQLDDGGVRFIARREDGVVQRFRVTTTALEDIEHAQELAGEALMQAFESHAQRISEVAGDLMAKRAADEKTWVITTGLLSGDEKAA